MKCLSHRKSKRVLNDKLIEKELRTPDLGKTVTPLQYISSKDMQVFPRASQQDVALRILPGEFYEPDPEITETAFNHEPILTKKDLSDSGLTKKDLSDSGIYTSLSDLEKSEIDPNDPDSLTEFLNEKILLQLQYSP